MGFVCVCVCVYVRFNRHALRAKKKQKHMFFEKGVEGGEE